VAEFQPGRTRVVLEVDDLASYNAFLLPNPYRLIIDVHGKQSRSTLLAKANPAHAPPAAAETDSSADDDAAEQPSDQPVEAKRAEGKSGKQGESAVPNGPYNFPRRKLARTKTKLEGASQHPDAPPTAATSGQQMPGIGVVKTTVPVAGTNRKIPKTIVEAEDRVPTTVATLQPDKLRPEVTPAQRAAIAELDEAKSSKVDTSHLAQKETALQTLRQIPPTSKVRKPVRPHLVIDR